MLLHTWDHTHVQCADCTHAVMYTNIKILAVRMLSIGLNIILFNKQMQPSLVSGLMEKGAASYLRCLHTWSV